MDRWQIVGVFLILFGLVILVIMSGFIFTIIVTLLKLLAVFIGIIMIFVGVALAVGSHWMKGSRWGWGPPPSST